VSVWAVREPTGASRTFTACSSGSTSCTAQQANNNTEAAAQLFFSGGGADAGYFLLKSNGTNYTFGAKWVPPDGGTGDRYFLTQVADKQNAADGGMRQLFTVSYAPPDAGVCPGVGGGSNPGVPYLWKATTADGQEVRFAYKVVPTSAPDGGVPSECVLSSLAVADDPRGNPNLQHDVVRYAYVLDGGVESAGLLASVSWTPYGATQTYTYTPTGWTIDENGTLGYDRVSHAYGGDGLVSSTTDPAEFAYLANSTSSTCDAGPSSPTCLAARQESWSWSGAPSGAPTRADTFQRTYELWDTSFAPESKVHSSTDACNGAPSCSPGTRTWQWAQYSSGRVAGIAEGDKRGNWTAYLNVEIDAGVPMLERRAVIRGGLDYTGDGGVERTDYTYIYGPSSSGTPQQLVRTDQKSSVLSSGQNATTTYNYDSVTNRLKSVVRTGYTQVYSGGSWTTVQRSVGTFYFTRRVCTGEAVDDPLGRVLEVHGPCLVSGPGALDCDAAPLTNTPVTQYAYFPSNTGNNNANQLQQATRFTGNTGPTSCSGQPSLTTSYSGYDARGNPGSVTDSNGVVTTYTYSDDRVTSMTVAGATTRYGYDNGQLNWIQHPEGNYDVYCYRPSGFGHCSTAYPWTGRRTAHWRAPSSDGTGYSEVETFDYNRDGSLHTRNVYDSTGQRRSSTSVTDLEGRLTYSATGQVGGGAFVAVKLFDGANNLIGNGLPFNVAPVLCGGVGSGGGPTSPLCSALAYDRANRLIGTDEFPTSTTSARTCLSYDAQGNVVSVKTGCSATSTPADCSTCTTPTATYQYDDFGNVVTVTAPWTNNGSNGSGVTRYEFEARGLLVRKQTPAMVANGELLVHAYDGLGRETSLIHSYALPSSGSETLYAFAYDTAATLDASCPQPSRTLGRLLNRTDSFGTTWFQYDALGRLTGEIRLRTGVTTCSTSTPNANPHTLYTYSPNGNLTSIVNPYGRTVTYTYGVFPSTSATTDHVSSVSVTMWNGTAWTATGLISNVTWEPFGGIRSYQLLHQAVNQSSGIEYVQAQSGTETPPTVGACRTVPTGSSTDFTGRVAVLAVSTVATGGTYSPGTATGNIYNRGYTWKADQVVQEDTCLLGATGSHTVTYGYDQTLRLTSAASPNVATVGGALASRAYGYDGRGNRTSEAREDCSYALLYGITGHPDQLTTQSSSCSGAILAHSYGYDRDGRVTTKTWPVDSSGDAGTVLALSSAIQGTGSHGGLETVYKSIAVNGAVYGYYYDALNRRRLKAYPAGPVDEYFHDLSNQILLDQGNDSVTSPAWYPLDEYVWVGGRPLVVIRSKLSTTFVRQSDGAGDCTRNADTANCGVYFPVTDPIGKPVVMLDSSRRVTGAAEYDAFGLPNRVSLDKETAHPYANNTSVTLADFIQPLGGTANPSTTVRLRVLFDLLDTEGPSTGPADYVFLKDPDGGVALTSNIGGPHRGQVWSPWVTPSAGRIQVPFISNASGNTYSGVVMAGYAYQRFQTGASPFWTPLRFPGQYQDDETDLFQNWNRFYDPSIGRYLEPEPLLARPGTTSAYQYGGANPLAKTDPTGLYVIGDRLGDCPNWYAALKKARDAVGCTCEAGKACQQQLRVCGTCDLCQLLAPGEGPNAYVEKLGKFGGADNVGLACSPNNLIDRTIGRCNNFSGEWKVIFDTAICTDFAKINELAKIMVHEAVHECPMIGGKDPGEHGGCGAYDITSACGLGQ
jgi:RHS repeat-associated protein